MDTPLGVVLAAGGLPGEDVRLSAVRREGRVMRGQLAELRLASPERREPECPHGGECGGCPLAIASPGLERQIKQAVLERALQAFEARPEIAWVDAAGRDAYRTRARLHFAGGLLGYRARRRRGLVDVSRCAVLVPSLGRAIELLRERVMPELRGAGEISLSLGVGGAVIALETAQLQRPALYVCLEALHSEPGIAGITARIGSSAPARFGSTQAAAVGADGQPLELPGEGFAQAQESLNQELARYVAQQAEPAGRRVLELYAGAGNLSVLLARQASRFESVESSRDAVDAARRNLRARGIEAKLVCGAAEEQGARSPIDVLVLDPPREGALRALDPALRRRPSRVVYVSCQPSTLGRDLGVLRAASFELSAVCAFDMFPQTAHLESVVTLTRKT